MNQVTHEPEVLSHHFSSGVYCKLVRIPNEYTVQSHKHKFDHMSMLVSGSVVVETEQTQQAYNADDGPVVIEIKAGVAHAITSFDGDAIWACIHATDCTDESSIDEILVLPPPAPNMVKADFMLDVIPLVDEIHDNPELWDEFNFRTKNPNSPHRDGHDIILRYNAIENYNENAPQDFAKEHESVWYPAVGRLPSFERVFNELLDNIPDCEVGGILITKVPAGKSIAMHSDAGHWHPEYYSTKILILLQSVPGQEFVYANGERYEGGVGEVFFFNNLPEHSVLNPTDIDRISLIVAVKEKS